MIEVKKVKYAIDRYAIGTEKEVSADEFDNKYFIHALKDRFFCPECGERVFLRNGKYYENCFYHQKKTCTNTLTSAHTAFPLWRSRNEPN